MPQFSAEALSRLLLNVDRRVLVAAIDQADLWDVFGSFERAALIELGEAQNLIANELLLGSAPDPELLGDLAIILLELSPRLPRYFQVPAAVLAGSYLVLKAFDVKLSEIAEYFGQLDLTREDEPTFRTRLIAELREHVQNLQSFRFALKDDTRDRYNATLERLTATIRALELSGA